MPVEIVCCRSGLQRHAPGTPLSSPRTPAGRLISLVDCFDKCTTCELRLLARLDGSLMRFKDLDAVDEAARALEAA